MEEIWTNTDLTGETWNLMKIGYQLKQVRERLAKGLVDKGILRTEKRNFLLFDMATHPVADGGAKDEIRRRVRNVLTQRTVVLPASQWLPENLEFRYLRTIAMLCAAYAANVLENALTTLGHEARERAFAQVDELLAEYSQWPFGRRAGGGQAAVGANLDQVIRDEVNGAKDKELQLEVSLTGQILCADANLFPRSWQRALACSLVWTPYSRRPRRRQVTILILLPIPSEMRRIRARTTTHAKVASEEVNNSRERAWKHSISETYGHRVLLP